MSRACCDGMASVPQAGTFSCGCPVIPPVAIPVSGLQPVTAPPPAPVPSAAAPISIPLPALPVPVSVSSVVSVTMPIPKVLMLPVMKPVPLSIMPVTPILPPVAPVSTVSAVAVLPVSTHETTVSRSCRCGAAPCQSASCLLYVELVLQQFVKLLQDLHLCAHWVCAKLLPKVFSVHGRPASSLFDSMRLPCEGSIAC